LFEHRVLTICVQMGELGRATITAGAPDMRTTKRSLALLVSLIAALSLACGQPAAPALPGSLPPLTLPSQLVGRAEVLPVDAPGYERADLGTAVRPPGDGNVSRAMVIRLTEDVPVFRMWNGPAKVDANGRTNRIGSWWTYDAPQGNVREYRKDYEICVAWNDLAWVATCTLKKGAVVAIGPGNSVSAATCGDKTGKENYPPNNRDWQLYVARAFERIGPGKELECPDPSADYEANQRNLAKRKNP
jgi:hypothetical protein